MKILAPDRHSRAEGYFATPHFGDQGTKHIGLCHQALLMHVSPISEDEAWPQVHGFRQDVLLCHANETQSTGYGDTEISSLSEGYQRVTGRKAASSVCEVQVCPFRVSPAEFFLQRGKIKVREQCYWVKNSGF